MSKPFDISELRSLPPKCGQTRLVAIDGHGGSGKSALASKLATTLGCTVIQTDDLASFENPLNWWSDLIDKVFRPIERGYPQVEIEPTQWWANQPKPATVVYETTPIIVVEGVSSSRREFRGWLSFSIFVDTPRELCFARGVERDRANGESEEVIKAKWQDWFEAEDEYINRDNPQDFADLVVEGTRPFEELFKSDRIGQ